MTSNGSKALVLFEGSADEYQFKHLIDGFLSYLKERGYEPILLETSIYELYEPLIGEEGDPEFDSLPSYLFYKGKVECPDNVRPQDQYSLIYLIFDFDPCYHLYEEKKILALQDYFQDETINGKLYLNYPMVEAIFDFSKDKSGNIVINKEYPLSRCNSEPYKDHIKKDTAFRNPANEHIYKFPTRKLFATAALLSKKRYEEIVSSPSKTWYVTDSSLLLRKEVEAVNSGVIYPLSAFPFLELDYDSDEAIKRWTDLLEGDQ